MKKLILLIVLCFIYVATRAQVSDIIIFEGQRYEKLDIEVTYISGVTDTLRFITPTKQGEIGLYTERKKLYYTNTHSWNLKRSVRIRENVLRFQIIDCNTCRIYNDEDENY